MLITVVWRLAHIKVTADYEAVQNFIYLVSLMTSTGKKLSSKVNKLWKGPSISQNTIFCLLSSLILPKATMQREYCTCSTLNIRVGNAEVQTDASNIPAYCLILLQPIIESSSILFNQYFGHIMKKNTNLIRNKREERNQRLTIFDWGFHKPVWFADVQNILTVTTDCAAIASYSEV